MKKLVLVLLLGCSSPTNSPPDINLQPKEKEEVNGYVIYAKRDTAKVMVISYKEKAMTDQNLIICPSCNKRYIPVSNRWIQMSSDVFTLIHRHKMPVEDRNCPECSHIVEMLIQSEQHEDLMALRT